MEEKKLFILVDCKQAINSIEEINSMKLNFQKDRDVQSAEIQVIMEESVYLRFYL